MDILKYKEYEGTAELDMDRFVCRGKILFINDLVIYEANTPAELQHAFEAAVDDYLETCAELEREPQKPLKGVFNVRISPELHKKCTLRAKIDGVYLNDVVARALTAYVSTHSEVKNTFHVNIFTPEDQTMETGYATSSQKATFYTRTANASN